MFYMTLEVFLPSIILIIGFIVLAILIKSQKAKSNDTALIEWLKAMQTSIDRTNKTLNEAMRDSTTSTASLLQSNTKQLNERLDMAARVIGDLKKNVGEMNEVGKGIRDLQEFLQSPKMRGNLGEQVLSDMIGQTFPKNSFYLQYAFRSGMKVDAVIKTDAGLLCIDSKFPMGNFTAMHKSETETERAKAKKDFVSDVKKHLGDISKKYILPEEETMDFALMYIPSESVYYEVVNSQELMDFAKDSRVYPVSPNTLYAHLQVLLLSFQGKELEHKSREVLQLLRAVQKDYVRVEEQMSVLNKHITNSYNTVNAVNSGFAALGQKLSRTSELTDGK